MFNANETGFAKAETICVRNGGHLVSIHDAFINDIITQYAPGFFKNNTSSNFWIGANSIETKNDWQWSDESVFDFNDWGKSEPQNSSDLYCTSASMLEGYWKAEDCFTLKPFVCGILNGFSTKVQTSTFSISTTKTITTKIRANISTIFNPPTTTISTIPVLYYCPGWTYFEPTKSYYCMSSGDYDISEYSCNRFGGHLVSIHNDLESELVTGKACY
uniref:C-type lectin domain-containing protein n=1 Tax=Panagrolaimus sp. ES5 TaxID=591445 RepID=A0AC34FT57_9BILA